MSESIVDETPTVDPWPLPRWIWFTLLTLNGAYAGWWGKDYWNWLPVLGLISAAVGVGLIWTFRVWLVRLRQSDRPFRSLSIFLFAYGLPGGLFYGIVAAISGLMIALFVSKINAVGLRIAAGAIAGVVACIVGSWQVARRRAKKQLHENLIDPADAEGK
jgi:uncharacterized membrane protein YeiB